MTHRLCDHGVAIDEDICGDCIVNTQKRIAKLEEENARLRNDLSRFMQLHSDTPQLISGAYEKAAKQDLELASLRAVLGDAVMLLRRGLKYLPLPLKQKTVSWIERKGLTGSCLREAEATLAKEEK